MSDVTFTGLPKKVAKLEQRVEALAADNSFLQAAAQRASNIEKHRDELLAEVERLRAALEAIAALDSLVDDPAPIARKALEGDEDGET